MEKELNEQQSIDIIKEMINSARKEIKEDGFLYMLWGWLVLAAALGEYFLLRSGYAQHYITWPVLMIGGAIVSIIYGKNQSKKKKAKTLIDRFMSYLWSGFVISLLIVLFSMSRIGIEAAYPIILILYGLGTYVSGGALKFTPLIIGGIACWILALVAFFNGFEIQLLLISAGILVAYIIPGHLLRSSYNSTHV